MYACLGGRGEGGGAEGPQLAKRACPLASCSEAIRWMVADDRSTTAALTGLAQTLDIFAQAKLQ